jgi:hypothetical protein
MAVPVRFIATDVIAPELEVTVLVRATQSSWVAVGANAQLPPVDKIRNDSPAESPVGIENTVWPDDTK